ncbi:glycosyltransferase family 2 protein [Patescibacteria group bacterium]
MKIQLSIVVLNYNTADLTINCLKSLEKVSDETGFEVMVVDNASVDDSVEKIKQYISKNTKYKTMLIQNKDNLGFSKGNNAARKYCNSKFVLFLNSDTLVSKGALKKPIDYLYAQKEVGAITVKMKLPGGGLDKDARRSFPTPWVSLTHLVFGLDKVFPTSKLFARYWYGYIPATKTHEIDVIQGAFFLVRREILDEVGWFDEDYFFTGEDIDLSWKIKVRGYKLVYYSQAEIVHIKQASRKITPEAQRKSVESTTEAMELFYRKHWWDRYPRLLNWTVIGGIHLVKKLRVFKI